MPTSDPSAQLCVECAMCCDGSLFASVTLTDPTEAEQISARRIPVRVVDERHLFEQPCPALGSSGCSIYSDRPLLCGTYRCLLLKQVEADTIPLAAAQGLVRAARQREPRIRELLTQYVSDDGSPIVQLYRRFALEHLDQLASPEFRAANSELIERFADHQAELAEHFEPSITEI